MSTIEKEYWQGIFWDYIEPFFRKNIIEPAAAAHAEAAAAQAEAAAAAQAEAAAAAAQAEAAEDEAEADAEADDKMVNSRIEQKIKNRAAEAAPEAEEVEEVEEAKIKNKTRYYIQRSIIGMTFIDDYLCMLEEIAGTSPDIAGSIPGRPNARELIEKATNIINNIFDYYSKVKSGTHYIYMEKRVQNTQYTLTIIKSIFNNPRSFSNDIRAGFFNTIKNILEYFEHFIKVKEKPEDPEFLEKEINESFLKYMENVYPAGPGAAAAAAGPAADEGGSFKIKQKNRRRKHNGSPRRKSLKSR
jgi:hypothetical protein